RAQIAIRDATRFVNADIRLCHLIEGALLARSGKPAATNSPANSLSLELQKSLSDGPTTIERADEVFFRHLHVGEECLAEWRIAGDELDGSDLYAGRFHIDEQKADAFVLARVVGAHETEAPVGELCAGGPDLLAVDKIVIALVHALRAQAGEVRTCA